MAWTPQVGSNNFWTDNEDIVSQTVWDLGATAWDQDNPLTTLWDAVTKTDLWANKSTAGNTWTDQ